MEKLRCRLNQVLHEFNRKDYIHSDPIQIPHRYKTPLDQEMTALFTALFCFGNVKAIVKTVDQLLKPLGMTPTRNLIQSSDREIKKIVGNSKYRFFISSDIEFAFRRLRDIYQQSPTGLQPLIKNSPHALGSLIQLRKILTEKSPKTNGIRFMFPDPEAGAAKRLHMFLRWMVRKDEVDFGLWNFLLPADLHIPLDVHLFELCRGLGLTELKSPSLKAMSQITNQLRKLDPADPIKYDFALCRLGILGMKKNFLSQK